MMKVPQIPQDDLMDVMEMADKIEKYLCRVLATHDKNLAISALMSANINFLFAQSDTLEEIIYYRTLFMQFLDSSISQIQVKKPEKPS